MSVGEDLVHLDTRFRHPLHQAAGGTVASRAPLGLRGRNHHAEVQGAAHHERTRLELSGGEALVSRGAVSVDIHQEELEVKRLRSREELGVVKN